MGRANGINDRGGETRLRPGRLDKALTVFAGVAAAALLFVVVVQVRQKLRSEGPYRLAYEGRILDKSVTITESQTGSRAAYRLHLAGRDGARFEIVVNRDFYERAQVGMWVRSDHDGAKLSWSEPPAARGAKAEGAEPPSVSAPPR